MSLAITGGATREYYRSIEEILERYFDDDSKDGYDVSWWCLNARQSGRRWPPWSPNDLLSSRSSFRRAWRNYTPLSALLTTPNQTATPRPRGKIDLTVSLAGFPDGYTQLAPDARVGRVYATRVEVAIASLADVEHSKRLADRPKDRAYLTRVARLNPLPRGRESVSRDRDYGHGYEEKLEPPSR